VLLVESATSLIPSDFKKNTSDDSTDNLILTRLPVSLTEKAFEDLWDRLRSLSCWEFSMVSAHDAPWTFWCAPFADSDDTSKATKWRATAPEIVKQISTAIIPHVEKLVGASIYLRRCFLNGHTYGQDGTVHQDAPNSVVGAYTLVFYPCLEWPTEWEGETVIHTTDHREIMRSFAYLPNTFLLWDSRIWHVGRAPSRICPELRMTLVWNFRTRDRAIIPASQ
jgi:hypothetical protein